MSTNRTLQRELMLTGIDSDNPFQTTLFGWKFLLLGVDATDRIVYRHPLQKETRVSGEALQQPIIPVKDFDSKGFPRTSYNRPYADDFIGSRYFRFVSEGIQSVRSLDDGEHTVVGWYLIGINGNDAADTAPYAGAAPEGEQGNGRFGIGGLLDATALAEVTNDGRMCLQWRCDPIQVSASSALPLLFTRQDDGTLRLTRTHWDRNGVWDSVKKESRLTEAGSSALMTLDLTHLFDPDAQKTDLPKVFDAYGEELVRRALELDQAAGIDSQIPVSPLTELPSSYTDLLARQDTDNLIEGFVGSSDSIGVANNLFHSGDGNFVSAVHEPGFVWPGAGQGVKLTLNFRFREGDNYSGYGCIFKIAKVSSNFGAEPSVLRIQQYYENPELNSVGTYDGTYSVSNSGHHRTRRDKDTVKEFDGIYYNMDEVYVFPDGQAYVYREGRYAGSLTIPDFLITPGEQYTLGASFLQGWVYLNELKVEAFDVPDNYVPVERPPMITGVDLSGTRSGSLDPEWLLDPNTDTNTGRVGLRPAASDENHIEFNVTTASKLSIFMRPDYRGEWELRRLEPRGNERPFDAGDPLDPVNLSSFLTGETPVNDWYTFPLTLPSGRYSLHCTTSIDDNTYVDLRRWRVDPVESDQPMLTDTWPLGATFESSDIASTLNSEQLEFEADVNGVHLRNYGDSFSFTVTHDAKLRIHPHTNAGRVRLHRVDGKSLSLVSDQLVSGQWYEFPYRIPAGRYQLSGINAEWTTLTAWEASAPDDLPEAPDVAVAPEFTDIVANTYYSTGEDAIRVLSDGLTHVENTNHLVDMRSNKPIEFDVTEVSLLTVHSSGDVGPSGLYGRVRLELINGQNSNFVWTSPNMRKRSWYTFPMPLEPGRYRLRGTYASYRTVISEWHLSPANQLQLPSAPVIYDIDGKDTTWVESETNAHTVLTDGVIDGFGGDYGVHLNNDLGTDYLRFRLSKPADLLITPGSSSYVGPVTLRRVNPTGSITDVAVLALDKAREVVRFGHEFEAGRYMIYAHGDFGGSVTINQLAAEGGENLLPLPPRAQATVTASVNTGRSVETTQAALTDLSTPTSSRTTPDNSIPLKTDAYVEFTLDSEAVMNLFVSASGHRVALYRMIGEAGSAVEEAFYAGWPTTNIWASLPFNMPAGTYRLYGGAPSNAYGPIISEWAFSLPNVEYTTTPPPSIMDIDASGSAGVQGHEYYWLANGETFYDPAEPDLRCVTLKAAELDVDGNEIAPAQNVVWFTLTQDAGLSLFSAGGGNDPVQLLSEDGVTVDLTTGPLTDEDWTSFGQTIPAGRYQLIGQGHTIITEIKAEAPVAAV